MNPLYPGRLLRAASLSGFGVLAAAAAVVIVGLAAFGPQTWWRTPDQRAQRLFDDGHFAAAAEVFTSPQRRGAALFRDGQFEAAAREFARDSSAVGHFNRGNALVMLGKYDEAIAAYEQALSRHGAWPAAANNLEIARLRAEKTRREGGDMTGGQLEADEIVFDGAQQKREGGGEEQTEGGQGLSDSDLRALWLRRVQTKPADFLRSKFAFQLGAQKVEGGH